MLPIIVLLLVLLYLVLKGTGLLNELIKIQRNPADNIITRIISQTSRVEPVEEERLDVYREYFDEDPDPEAD